MRYRRPNAYRAPIKRPYRLRSKSYTNWRRFDSRVRRSFRATRPHSSYLDVVASSSFRATIRASSFDDDFRSLPIRFRDVSRCDSALRVVSIRFCSDCIGRLLRLCSWSIGQIFLGRTIIRALFSTSLSAGPCRISARSLSRISVFRFRRREIEIFRNSFVSTASFPVSSSSSPFARMQATTASATSIPATTLRRRERDVRDDPNRRSTLRIPSQHTGCFIRGHQ